MNARTSPLETWQAKFQSIFYYNYNKQKLQQKLKELLNALISSTLTRDQKVECLRFQCTEYNVTFGMIVAGSAMTQQYIELLSDLQQSGISAQQIYELLALQNFKDKTFGDYIKHYQNYQKTAVPALAKIIYNILKDNLLQSIEFKIFKDFKESVLEFILTLPAEEKKRALMCARSKTQALGKLFWYQRGLLLQPSLERGTLRRIVDELNKFESVSKNITQDSLEQVRTKVVETAENDPPPPYYATHLMSLSYVNPLGQRQPAWLYKTISPGVDAASAPLLTLTIPPVDTQPAQADTPYTVTTTTEKVIPNLLDVDLPTYPHSSVPVLQPEIIDSKRRVSNPVDTYEAQFPAVPQVPINWMKLFPAYSTEKPEVELSKTKSRVAVPVM